MPMKYKIAQWIFLVVLVVIGSAAIIYDVLVTGQWGFLLPLVSLVVGMCVGDLLIRGAYRLFDLGESALRFIAWGVGIGGAIIWLILLLVPVVPQGAGDIAASMGILGFIIRAVTRANVISKQLRTEDRRP
jgi:hypothetical protein